MKNKIIFLMMLFVLVPTVLATEVRFAVIGDYGETDTKYKTKEVADLVDSWNVDFIITVGDNSYEGGTNSCPGGEQYDQAVGQFYDGYMQNGNEKFWPSIGNHDYCTSGGSNYFDYFDYLPNSPGNKKYYKKSFGLVDIFALNYKNDLSAQKTWLKQELQSSTATYKIVYFHTSPYTLGSHSADTKMRWDFAGMGATAVLTGHDHNYQRFSVGGIPYIVNGLGGRGSYSNWKRTSSGRHAPEQLTHYNDNKYAANNGAMLVVANDAGIVYSFYDIDINLIDEGFTKVSSPQLPSVFQQHDYLFEVSEIGGTVQSYPDEYWLRQCDGSYKWYKNKVENHLIRPGSFTHKSSINNLNNLCVLTSPNAIGYVTSREIHIMAKDDISCVMDLDSFMDNYGPSFTGELQAVPTCGAETLDLAPAVLPEDQPQPPAQTLQPPLGPGVGPGRCTQIQRLACTDEQTCREIHEASKFFDFDESNDNTIWVPTDINGNGAKYDYNQVYCEEQQQSVSSGVPGRVYGGVSLSQPSVQSDSNLFESGFLNKVETISKEIGDHHEIIVNPVHLLAVMKFETAGTFGPCTKNPNSSATGLIQFMDDTAISLGTTTDALCRMTQVQQLDYVKTYYINNGGRIRSNNFGDVAMTVIWPAAVGKSDSYILFSSGSGQYSVNSGLDRNSPGNNDGDVSRAEYMAHVEKKAGYDLGSSSLSSGKNVLVVGTSTTAHGRYVDYLNDALGSQGYTFTAKGYSGCSTSAVNNRLRSGAMANNCLSSPSSVTGFDIDDYDTLMVLSGLNDGLCSGTPTTTEGWLQEIYDYGESQGMKVIAITMTPAKSYFDGACSGGTAGGDNSVIYTVKVNDWITTGARHLDKIVDVYSVLNDGSGSLQSQYSSDGLHQSNTGQDKIGETIVSQAFS